MRRLTALLAAAACSVAPAGASAQAAGDDPLARGIDPIGNKLAATIDAFLTVEGARTAPHGSYKLELAFDYAEGLMALQLGEDKIGDLVERRLDLHLLGAYAATDWGELGLDLPFTIYQEDGFDLLEERTGFVAAPAAAGGGIGDPRVLYKLQILAEKDYLLTVGAVGELRLPLGDDQSFMGERSVVLAPRAVIERTFLEKLRLAIEGGYRFRGEPGRYINLYVGDELIVAGAASYKLPDFVPELRNLTAYGELIASTPSRAPFTVEASEALKTPLEALVGARAAVSGCWQVMLGGGTGIAGEAGFGRESFRLFTSVRCEHIAVDTDEDGVPDAEDLCPTVPEDKDGIQDEDGCPDDDADGDGVPDKDDKCPTVPGPKEYQGCPDSDADEIPDNEDKCPDEKGPAQNDGCPVKAEEPEVLLEETRLTLKDSISFDTGKATIKKDSFRILDEAAAILIAHPEVKRLRIEGHTDSQGSARVNQDLSQKRAQAVVDYLFSKKVERSRLFARGFGEDRPISTNETALGRAKNRRVEFAIVQEGEGEETPVPPAPPAGAPPTGSAAPIPTPGPGAIPAPSPGPATAAAEPGLPAALRPLQGPQAGVVFDAGSAKVTKKARASLDRAAALLKKHAGWNLAVVAVAGDGGDPAKNEALAKARAEIVRKYLVLSGVPAGRITATGSAAPAGAAPQQVGFSLKK